MNIIVLTLQSMLHRRLTLVLTVFSIALSVTLLLAVEKIRTDARSSFTNTISGTDLLIGARSGSVQLLLYSVFRIGNATNNISWESYEKISGHSSVRWSIPISLGDSHRGFRVMGTSKKLLQRLHLRRKTNVGIRPGRGHSMRYSTPYSGPMWRSSSAISSVKKSYSPTGWQTWNSRVTMIKPFTVVGILEKTGTPVDRSIHVSLEGIEAMHVDWQSGTRSNQKISAQEALTMDLQPTQITAFMLNLNSKIKVFSMQRAVNEFREEPLLAVLPGVALQELWDLIAVGENALLAVSLFVIASSFIGLLTGILTSLNERRREIAILRALGARRYQVSLLLLSESLLTTLLGVVLGVVIFYVLILLAQPLAQSEFGLSIPLSLLGAREALMMAGFALLGLLSGALPAWRAYRNSLHDGMTPKY